MSIARYPGLNEGRSFALAAVMSLILGTGTIVPSQSASSSTLWKHNASIVYLVASGSSREFRYQQPRPGMLAVGARSGSLIFSGVSINGRYEGTAYIYNGRCGSFAYPVSGPILNNFERVVVSGQAPRVGADCRVQGFLTDTLDFVLLNSTGLPETTGTVVPVVPPGQAELSPITSQWIHNGSIVSFEEKDGSVEIDYLIPRGGLGSVGVQEGTTLFYGARNGDAIEGTAYVFNARSGPLGYEVHGEMLSEGTVVLLSGLAPHVNANCEVVWKKLDYLRFDRTM
jgi:hypothetical protein